MYSGSSRSPNSDAEMQEPEKQFPIKDRKFNATIASIPCQTAARRRGCDADLASPRGFEPKTVAHELAHLLHYTTDGTALHSEIENKIYREIVDYFCQL
jgi:hypothetical protein